MHRGRFQPIIHCTPVPDDSKVISAGHNSVDEIGVRIGHSLALCALLLTSCATLLGGRYNYNLEVRNIGTERISDCESTSEKGFWHRQGTLVPKAGKSIGGPFRYPYADHWTVTWKTAKGEEISRTIDLTKAFPKAFEGRLVLTIDQDNKLEHFTEPFGGR